MIHISHLTVEYDKKIFDNQSINFYPKQVSLIMGESGVGKTSLLYRIGLLSHIDYEMEINGLKIHEMNDKELSDIRRYHIGFVLQEKDIIENFNVYENICFYGNMVGRQIDEKQAKELLEFVSLDIPFQQDVMTLSLGERQRLAIACVLAKNPDIFIFDEPTSSLDSYNQDIIFNIIQKLAHQYHKYVIISSHSPKAIEYADWIYHLENQHIEIQRKSQEEKIELQEKRLTHSSFVLQYVKLYLHKYRHIQITMFLLLSFILCIGCFSYVYIDNNMQKAESRLFKQFDQQLFIVNDKDALRIDKKISPFQMNTNKNIYPYIKVTLNNNPEIEVIPYFDSMNFDDRMQERKGVSSIKGIYVSQKARPFIDELLLTDTKDVQLDIYEYGNQLNIHTLSYPLKINGYLKNGVQNYYTNKDHPYIYVYYQDLFEFYQRNCQSQKFIGYIYSIQDYHDFSKIKDNYIKKGYFVNDDFIKLEQIQDVVKQYSQIQNYFFIAMMIISSILILSIGIYIYRRRSKELTILKLNGISINELITMFIYEYSIEILGAMVLSFMILQITDYLCIQYLYVSLFIVMMFVLIFIISKVLLTKQNVEDVLRNYE